jgi:hypothetical protein
MQNFFHQFVYRHISKHIKSVVQYICTGFIGIVDGSGLLADEMGLGKTLSILALIASDLKVHDNISMSNEIPLARQLSSTLVVVPLSCECNRLLFITQSNADIDLVLSEWEAQLRR